MARQAPVAPIAGGGEGARSALVNPVPSPARISIGEGLAIGVGAVLDQYEKDRQQRDKLRSIELEERLKREVGEATAQLDPLAPDYDNELEAAVRDIYDSVLSEAEFASEEARLDFELRAKELTEGSITIALGQRRQALAEEALRLRGEAMDQALASIRRDPDAADLYLKEFASKAERFNDALPPAVRPQLEAEFADAALRATAEGLAFAGRFAEARKLADEHQGELSPEQYRGLKQRIREIENTARNDALAASSREVADLEIAITDARTVDDLNALRERVTVADSQGLFAGRQDARASLIKQIEARKAKIIKEQKDLAVALGHFASGTGVDSQKEADLVWEQYAKQMPEEAMPEQMLGHIAQFAAKAGWVPSPVKRLIENAERIDDPQALPEALASAAAVYDAVRGVAPEVDTGAAEKGSRVRLTSAAADLLGLSYDDAARMVASKAPDKAELERRRQQFAEDFTDFDAREFLYDEGAAASPLFGADTDIPGAAARDFERLLRLHYELSGDADIARVAALQRFSELYGETRVGGQPRLMRHAPERYFPGATNNFLAPEEKTAIIEADVRRHLERFGIAPAIVRGAEGVATPERDRGAGLVDGSGLGLPESAASSVVDTSDLPPFQLSADEQTLRDLKATGRPSYVVQVRNEFGLLQPVVVELQDGRNVTLRYRMPTIEELQALPEYQALVEAEKRWGETKRELKRRLPPPTDRDTFRERLWRGLGGPPSERGFNE